MRWSEIINETASAGASASGNVASCVSAVGGLGVGMDPSGDWGIYNSKKPGKKQKKKTESVVVIRR